MAFPIVGQSNLGFRTFFGTWVAPGARVTFCGPAGVFEDTFTENNRVGTLQAALARCRVNKGDVVILLPGFAENVTTADFYTNLVAGTRIVGTEPIGSPLMPTLTFTATDATFLIDQQGVTLSGVNFVSGIDGVVNFVTVTGARARIQDCSFFCGFNTSTDGVVPLILATGSGDSVVEGNQFFGILTAVNPAMIQMTGTGVHSFVIRNNYLYGSCATNGVISLTGTGVNFRIHDNVIFNTTATTPVGIQHADTALTGVIYNNMFAFTTDVTVLTAAVNAVGVATAQVRSLNNFGCDEDSLGGILVPTATGLE